MNWDARRRIEQAGGKTIDLAFSLGVTPTLARRWLREPPKTPETIKRVEQAIQHVERGYRAPPVNYRILDGKEPPIRRTSWRY